MSDTTSPDVVELFGRLIELEPEARAAELADLDLAPGDRAELDRLLTLDDRDDSWLDGLAATTLSDALDDVFRAGAEGADLGDQWELLEVIGRGGMGVVHRARDRRLDRIVALKFLPVDRRRDAVARDRLLAEARAASSLDHPAIGVVHQIGVTGPDSGAFQAGQPFIAMAYYEGETLAERAARDRVSTPAILEWAIQIADGLAHAHRAGVVHRDIKPSNVIVAADGRVKILDFGIAALRGSEAPAAGTRAYISPEQRAGGAPTPEDDVWSFGALLGELLTADTGGEPASDDASGELARRLTRLAATCRAEAPSDRPADAGAVAGELRRIRRDAVAAPRGTDRPRVAVLPFADIGLGEEDEWFADGVMEEILGRLARIEGLRVTSRATSMRMKGRLLSSDRIARELGVRYLLEGGVRRAGDTVRVNVRLLDTVEDHYLWTDAFQGPVAEIFDIQERVALGVAEALPLELSGPDRMALERRPLEDLRAWESYLRARHEAWRFSAEGLERARRHLNTALEIVGPNALLYSTLGHVEAISVDVGIAGGPEVLARVDDFADRTFELDPDSGRGNFLRAFAAGLAGDREAASAALTPALEGAAFGSEMFARALSHCRALAGDVEGGLEALRSAVRLGMLNIPFLERYDRFLEPLRDAPGFAEILQEARARAARIEHG